MSDKKQGNNSKRFQESVNPTHDHDEHNGSVHISILDIFAGILGFDTTLSPQAHRPNIDSEAMCSNDYKK